MLSVLFDVYTKQGASHVALMIKNLSANAGDIGDAILIPGLRRLPGGGHGSPLQHSCLEDPMKRGAWQATVHQVTKNCLSVNVKYFPCFCLYHWKSGLGSGTCKLSSCPMWE